MESLQAWLDKSVFMLSGQAVTIGEILLVPLFLAGAWVVYRILSRLVVRRLRSLDVSPDLIHLVQRVMLVIFLLLVVLSILNVLQVPLTAFAFLSGAVAIGVGFGAQNVVNNFISGWILMWEKPIRIGDFLEFTDVRGTVEAINTRSTRIRRVDGVHLLIPNSHLLENIVVNWTLIDNLARTSVRVGVAYGSPVEAVRDELYEIARLNTDVLDDPKPVVLFEDFGDSSLVFDLVFWVMATSERDLRVVRSDIRFEVNQRFAENDIVIAFPQRDVHINSMGPLDVRVVPERSQT